MLKTGDEESLHIVVAESILPVCLSAFFILSLPPTPTCAWELELLIILQDSFLAQKFGYNFWCLLPVPEEQKCKEVICTSVTEAQMG